VITATPEPVAAPVPFAPGQAVTRVDGRVGIVLGHDGGQVIIRWSDDRPVRVTLEEREDLVWPGEVPPAQ
jgi:hypothetical protein